jgi:hypothetical protein
MARPVHDPLLQEHIGIVGIGRLGIRVAARYLPARHSHAVGCRQRSIDAKSLLADIARVDHVDNLVMITVKDNEGIRNTGSGCDVGLPPRINANAEGTSYAAPYGNPECTPAAAYSWGYVAAMTVAIAAPAEKPAIKTRSGSAS